MSDTPPTPLSSDAIANMAPEIYDSLAKALAADIAEAKAKGQQFEPLGWISCQLLVECRNASTKERTVAVLIATTGLIHEYIEQEHGYHFVPNN